MVAIVQQILALGKYLWKIVSEVLYDKKDSMAGCGFDSDTSGMTIEDEETAEIVDPASFSFPVQNRFDARPEMQAGCGWELATCRSASVKKKENQFKSHGQWFFHDAFEWWQVSVFVWNIKQKLW